jgi:TonB family protein
MPKRTTFFLAFAVFVSSLASNASAQSSAQESSSKSPVPVFKSGPGIAPPTLTHVDFSAEISNSCERKFSGHVELSLVVDAKGVPHNIMFVKPAANDADRLAVVVASMDRFTAATNSGSPVAVGQLLEMKVEVCVVKMTQDGQTHEYLKLSVEPTQKLKPYDGYPSDVVFASQLLPSNPRSALAGRIPKIGAGISAPIPLATPVAEYSDIGRHKQIQGVCLVSVFVDSFGLPRDAIVTQTLEPTLDQKALDAVYRYRFKPAMKNKLEPVPVMITVEVNFRLG